MKIIWYSVSRIIVFTVMIAGNLYASETESSMTADQALAFLKDGNDRFINGKSQHPNQDSARRIETVTNGQHPFASILGCADSRVPLEVIFDRGIGDIFNVRVAGNVADIDEIGSLEYGAGHLKTPLIVVLGHSKCGAVTAVVKKDHVGPNIAKLVDNIIPAVAKAQQKNPSADVNTQIIEAITANVWQSIEDIVKHSPEIYELVETGKVKVVGALYDIETGKVTWLGTHPELIKIMVEVKLAEAKERRAPLKTVVANGSAGHEGAQSAEKKETGYKPAEPKKTTPEVLSKNSKENKKLKHD